MQSREGTPTPIWNPDLPPTVDYMGEWEEVEEETPYDNAFKAQWKLFLRHVIDDQPFRWDLREGAKGVQLAEIAYQSSLERRWLEVPELPQ